MTRYNLQEAAKFIAGVVAADFFWLLWFSQLGVFPVQFYGLSLTPDMVLPALVFDVAIFIILVHYGWNIGKIPAVRERGYLLIAGTIFSLVSLVHIWRLFNSVDIVIDGWEVPLWLSWFAVMITTYLAYTSFHFAMRMKVAKARR